jgi:hypothetical protein
VTFSARDARRIMREQKHPVRVFDADGNSKMMTGQQAADAVLDDVVGLGHKRCIKIVKPTLDAIARARQAHADLRDVMGSFPRTEHVQRNPQQRGSKEWTPQPSRARSGTVGGLRRVTMPGVEAGCRSDRTSVGDGR